MSEELEALKARIEELERRLNPPAPAPEAPRKPFQMPDYTEQMTPRIKPTYQEPREGQTLAEANMEFRKYANPVGTPMPLAQFLNQGRPLPEPEPAQAVTVPVSNKQPGIDAVDAIAQGFADRQRLEELAQHVDALRKLAGK